MRLDKYMKLVRLIKRRSLATELCRLGGVSVNQKVAKASTSIQVGDALELRFGNRLIRATVLALPQRAMGNLAAASTYVEITHQENLSTPLPFPQDDDDDAG